MTEIEDMMRISVRHVMYKSVTDYWETKRGKWMQKWPGMCVLNASQYHWTKEMEELIVEKGARGVERVARAAARPAGRDGRSCAREAGEKRAHVDRGPDRHRRARPGRDHQDGGEGVSDTMTLPGSASCATTGGPGDRGRRGAAG